MAEARKLEELADRVEKLTRADRDFDDEIARLVEPDFHFERGQKLSRMRADFWAAIGETPRYTASLDDAMTLVPEGHFWRLGYSRHVPHVAEIVDYGSHRGTFVSECDNSRACALTAASLRARAAQGEG